MARLHHYTGVDVELPLGEERVYGRADTNLELEKVSRCAPTAAAAPPCSGLPACCAKAACCGGSMLPTSNWLSTPHPAPCRQQFRLACTVQGLLLTSLGANPTKVWQGTHNRTQAVLLHKGKPGWEDIHMMLAQLQLAAASPACLHPQHPPAEGARANLASSPLCSVPARLPAPPPQVKPGCCRRETGCCCWAVTHPCLWK